MVQYNRPSYSDDYREKLTPWSTSCGHVVNSMVYTVGQGPAASGQR